MSALTLYNFDLDENCYRVRLLLSMLSLDAKFVAVDIDPRSPTSQGAVDGAQSARRPSRPHGRRACGERPVATLAYLARHYGGDVWAPPGEPALYARHVSWLEFGAGVLPAGDRRASSSLFGAKGDFADLAAQGRRALRFMEDRMSLCALDGEGLLRRRPRVQSSTSRCFPPSRCLATGASARGVSGAAALVAAVPRAAGFRTMPGVPDYG